MSAMRLGVFIAGAIAAILVIGAMWQERIPARSVYLRELLPYKKAIISYYERTGEIPASIDSLARQGLISNTPMVNICALSNKTVILSLHDENGVLLYSMSVGPLNTRPLVPRK
jgi:hypothetical protein